MRRMAAIVAVMVAAGGMPSAEPSVYGRSYGGGAQADKNSKMIYALRQQVNRLQEEIDGLRSVVEGLNRQVSELRRQKKGTTSGVTPEEISRLERRIAELEKRSASAKRQRTNTVRQTKSAAKSGEEKKSRSKRPDGPKDNALKKAASNRLFSRGVRLINQKRYAEAKRRFDILKERGYKPASTRFYLGEIAYRTGRYDDAIGHYQKSAELNENAAYMDRLLLHTGIALEKSGDKEQARNFFQAIVDGYPGTASARVAKKHLK